MGEPVAARRLALHGQSPVCLLSEATRRDCRACCGVIVAPNVRLLLARNYFGAGAFFEPTNGAWQGPDADG